MTKSCLMITHAYPYGINENWKKNDLEALNAIYTRVYVLPINYYNPTPKNTQIPSNVITLPPINTTNSTPNIITKITSRIPRNHHQCSEIWATIKRCNIRMISRCFQSISLQNRILSKLRKYFAKELKDCDLIYFFWGTEAAECLTDYELFKDRTTVVGFHNIDIYEDRQIDHYIPFHKVIKQTADFLAPCSEDAKTKLITEDISYDSKTLVKKIGVSPANVKSYSTVGVLRILTISNNNPVKRLHLIFKILSELQVPYVWTHIGSDLTDELHDLALQQRIPISSLDFRGILHPDDLITTLRSEDFDIFCNVSSFEGIPVTIMEALMFGIPVFATDVGGVAEVVSEPLGKLFQQDFEPKHFAQCLEVFHNYSIKKKKEMRAACHNYAMENLIGIQNSQNFFKRISDE